MYVFVYGTLKRRCPNHYMLENEDNGQAEFLCDAKTAELFPLIVTTKYDIPFLLDKSGIGNHVIGEVYTIDDKMLETLDKLEGYPLIYTRRKETVKPTNGQEPISAWIFTFQDFCDKLLLHETFHDTYVCNNYDVLRSLSGQFSPKEKAELFKEMRAQLSK